MHSGLRWLLVGTVLLTLLALWWPDDLRQDAPNRSASQPVAKSEQVAPAPTSSALAAAGLPERLPTTSFEPAAFDPFVGARPPPPPTPKPVAVVVMPVVQQAPPQAVAPLLSYRYLGQMTDPSGLRQVYLAKTDTAILVAVGTRLEEGYVVESITQDGVRLHYPPLDAHAVIPVPTAQDSSPR